MISIDEIELEISIDLNDNENKTKKKANIRTTFVSMGQTNKICTYMRPL